MRRVSKTCRVTTAIALGPAIPTRFLFPRETIAVFVNGWKQTSDMFYLRYYIGRREARKVLIQSYKYKVRGVWKQAPI
jgi:hypothetical protein